MEQNNNLPRKHGPKQMLDTKDSHLCEFTILENTTVYIFGGEPFAEERFIDWNFVSSSKELIEDAKQRWEQQTFGKIPGKRRKWFRFFD